MGTRRPEQMFQWISVKESLPPIRTPVLIRSLTEDGEIHLAAQRTEGLGPLGESLRCESGRYRRSMDNRGRAVITRRC